VSGQVGGMAEVLGHVGACLGGSSGRVEASVSWGASRLCRGAAQGRSPAPGERGTGPGVGRQLCGGLVLPGMLLGMAPRTEPAASETFSRAAEAALAMFFLMGVGWE
jgi:hypothetical protein